MGSQVQFQVRMVSFVRSFLFASTFLSLVLFIESRETAKRQEIDDALQYLTQMDRYYSEHVRPRFGKRGDAGGEGEEVKRSAAFLRSLMLEDPVLRDCAHYMAVASKKVKTRHISQISPQDM